MSTLRAQDTRDVPSYAHMMTNLSITKCHKMYLHHAYSLHAFIRNLIKKGKIDSFKTFVDNSCLFPKYWGAEKEYEVFHFEAEIVDIEEFIIVLIMSFKNTFDTDGRWGLKKQYSFFNLWSNFHNMWTKLPHIYKECVEPEALDKHGNLVTPEWLLYWYYFVNFQGGQNISIVNLVRIQDRSEYMAHLLECYDLHNNGGMGETKLVYQPLLKTEEGKKVFFYDIELALYAGLMNTTLKHGVNAAEWDPFELNTRSIVEVQIYFLANKESDYKEIQFQLENIDGIKMHSSAIKILQEKKPVVILLYRMKFQLNNFSDLKKTIYMSNPKFFEMIEVTDLDFFVKEQQIMQKECEEIEQMECDKIAMEEEEIFEENDKTVEDAGGYTQFDSEMGFKEEVDWLLEVEGQDGMEIESGGEENVGMQTNEKNEKKEEKEEKDTKCDDDFFQIGDTVIVTSKGMPERYRGVANNQQGVVMEIVDSPIAKYYGVELQDNSMHVKIAKCNYKAKKMEKTIIRRVIFVTRDHYVQCSFKSMKKV